MERNSSRSYLDPDHAHTRDPLSHNPHHCYVRRMLHAGSFCDWIGSCMRSTGMHNLWVCPNDPWVRHAGR